MLSFLYEIKGDVNHITNTRKLNIVLLKLKASKYNLIKIIKKNKGLFFLLDGTGQIYKATDLKDGYLKITRIDSTKYFGNTFSSIDFIYEDTLFSFGGYGFWHNNSQLRKFDQINHEWDIVKLNTPFYAHTISEYLDLKSSKLFYIQNPVTNEEYNSDIKDYSVISLDLINRENRELGLMNEELIKMNDFNYYIALPSLNGTLISSNRNYYLLQYDKNLVYKLENKKIIDAIQNPFGERSQFTFEKDNKLYYCAFPDTCVKSIDISIKDFSIEPYSIYEPKSSIKKYIERIIYITIISILLIFTFKLYFNKNKPTKKEIDDSEDISKNLDINDFSEVEKDLILALIEKSNKGSYLNIDEMNFVLGLKNKPMQIQKTVRNETINRINHKFNTLFGLETTFIIRIKSENDKRTFNYSIGNENILIYSKQKK